MLEYEEKEIRHLALWHKLYKCWLELRDKIEGILFTNRML